jgi:hypothetical protein
LWRNWVQSTCRVAVCRTRMAEQIQSSCSTV